jgi:hypothetical protein
MAKNPTMKVKRQDDRENDDEQAKGKLQIDRVAGDDAQMCAPCTIS